LTALTSIATSLSRIAAVALALLATRAGAAELVMFEDAGCVWCARFNAEVAPIYPKTDEGKRAPLRRVDSGGALPADLAFITPERLTPLFVLVDGGREIGRIRGYPGDDHFWGLLGVLMTKLDDAQKSGGEAIPPENSTRKAR
jgi:thioredoxin-related protein